MNPQGIITPRATGMRHDNPENMLSSEPTTPRGILRETPSTAAVKHSINAASYNKLNTSVETRFQQVPQQPQNQIVGIDFRLLQPHTPIMSPHTVPIAHASTVNAPIINGSSQESSGVPAGSVSETGPQRSPRSPRLQIGKLNFHGSITADGEQDEMLRLSQKLKESEDRINRYGSSAERTLSSCGSASTPSI